MHTCRHLFHDPQHAPFVLPLHSVDLQHAPIDPQHDPFDPSYLPPDTRDAPDAYKITATFADVAVNEYQYVEIILFDSGTTMLYVKGDGVDGETAPWIWDDVIDFYTEVRNIWKNVV